MFRVHDIVFRQENRPAESLGRTTIEDVNSPPQTPPNLALKKADLPTGEFFVEAQTHGHPNCQPEKVPSGIGLVPFLGIVAQQQ